MVNQKTYSCYVYTVKGRFNIRANSIGGLVGKIYRMGETNPQISIHRRGKQICTISFPSKVAVLPYSFNTVDLYTALEASYQKGK